MLIYDWWLIIAVMIDNKKIWASIAKGDTGSYWHQRRQYWHQRRQYWHQRRQYGPEIQQWAPRNPTDLWARANMCPGLRPTSAENSHRRPPSLPQRLGKRRHVEDGYREHKANMDREDLEAIERRISRANSRLHALRTQTIRECDYIEQEFASARRALQDLKQRRN